MADNRVLTDPQANWATSLFGNLPAKWTGFLRGLLLTVALAVVQSAVAYLQGHAIPGAAEANTASLVTVVMWLYGYIDHRRTARELAVLAGRGRAGCVAGVPAALWRG